MEKSLIIDDKYVDIFGKHYWEIIHLEALKVTILYEMNKNVLDKHIELQRVEFAQMFEYFIKNMTCQCRNHAYHILMINSYKKYKYMFAYTIDFHNQVNIRLGRKIVTYDEAFVKYLPILKLNSYKNTDVMNSPHISSFIKVN